MIKKIFFSIIIVFLLVFGLFSSVSAQELRRTYRDLSLEEMNRQHTSQSQQQSNQVSGSQNTVNSQQLYYQSFNKPLDVIVGNEDNAYIIVPGDSLTISFQNRNDVSSAIYQVSGRGDVYFPLVGPINLIDLNRQQATEKINKSLQKFIRNPKVKIEVNTSGKIMVVGSVGMPGVYPLSPRLTIMETLLNARYSKGAHLKNVVVMRGPPDNPIVKVLDLKKMIKKGDRSDNIFLKPGDLVYVPNSRMKNINNLISQIYDKVLIWYGLGGQDIIQAGEPFLGPFN